MHEILGEARTIRQLLSGTKYSIDYYQREYKWDSKQVTEIIDDLSNKFLEDFSSSDDRKAVKDYGHYFLGSIIISKKNNSNFIIDGQQRLTTLTLLLIFLYNRQKSRNETVNIDQLIYSEQYGEKSFNIDVEDRTDCMKALFEGKEFDAVNQSESIRNIVTRYEEIDDNLPETIQGVGLLHFVDWLIDNVHLVQITAHSDEDAYTIFETMNDRGLALTPVEMLKGYLLTNISDDKSRIAANKTWKKHVGDLISIAKEVDSDCIKSWLRSQYALTIRERKSGAGPEDFERIGTEFHRWVRDKDKILGFKSSPDFEKFINKDFDFYAKQFVKIKKAEKTFDKQLEHLYYLAQLKFTVHYPLLLSPLSISDSDEIASKKIRLVGLFVDTLLVRRVWNFRAIDYNAFQY